MINLTSSYRSYLKGQAHHLEPVVLIGKSGITDGTIQSINTVIESRELIKVKFREYKDEKRDLAEQIAYQTESSIVGIIGHTLILYRQNSDPEKQAYKLTGK